MLLDPTRSGGTDSGTKPRQMVWSKKPQPKVVVFFAVSFLTQGLVN